MKSSFYLIILLFIVMTNKSYCDLSCKCFIDEVQLTELYNCHANNSTSILCTNYNESSNSTINQSLSLLMSLLLCYSLKHFI